MSLPAPLNSPSFLMGVVIFIVASVLLYTSKIPLSVWTTVVGVLLGYYFGYHYGQYVLRRGG
jgi:hypothetical protein